MKGLFSLFLVFCTCSLSLCLTFENQNQGGQNFNVVSYGAKGDGNTDDSNAFLKAWEDLCSTTEANPTLVIPQGKKIMLQPMKFQGPCKSKTINVEIMGTIIAPKSRESWKWDNNDSESWIAFSHVNGLVISGEGTFDGQGSSWWNNVGEGDRPTALRIADCENLKLSGLKHINSPKNHLSINSCTGALIFNLHMTAPEDSPNTDGIDISSSTHIVIQQLVISTGDDCIAINSGSQFINITDVYCGPGHGISVGSLGKGKSYATVEDVYVRNITFTGTTNGARIKTWIGGSGYARKITYEDIKIFGVKNPVIIDQQYDALLGESRAVKVSDVTFRNIEGTANDEKAIELSCDRIGCSNIVLENINITGLDGKRMSASCNNVQGSCSSCTPNVPCLS
ncbi:probable polygalacturonase At3g15720 [Vicia villosa]|uniref:probable polygalacturonase At3g15720 n=1 Tax=Vicia villosa TaxID=3911 RepID=UPI00273AB5FF|nr:probable polygalacturonase At3g15720 [Vicia villosa]